MNSDKPDRHYNDGIGDMQGYQTIPELRWGRLFLVSLVIIACVILLVFFGYSVNRSKLSFTTISNSVSDSISNSISLAKTSVPDPQKVAMTSVSDTNNTNADSKPDTKTTQASPFNYKLIAGTYDGYKLARNYANHIEDKLSISPYLWSVDNDQLYAIQVGAYKTQADAIAAQSQLSRQGFSSSIWESGTKKTQLIQRAYYTADKQVNYPYKLIAGIADTEAEKDKLISSLEAVGIHHAYTWQRLINGKQHYYVQLGAYTQESHALTEQHFYKQRSIDTLIQIIN